MKTAPYAQPDQLFENTGGGRFKDISKSAGRYFQTAWVGRGAAFGDIDNDGDLDILVTNSNQKARLLRNEAGNNWIMLKLASRHKGRDDIGALVRVTTGDLVQVEEVRSGSSYLSQNDLRLHFGLGGRQKVDRVEIRWPDGQVQQLTGAEVKLNQITTVQQ